MKRCLYAFLALSIALTIRLYPTVLSGLPFSVDAWSPIRNTELLLEHTPINLDDQIMDGYNCYWPANSLFGAVFSIVTGLKPLVAMAVGVPMAGALTILLFYVLIGKMSRSPELAFTSSILFAVAYPHTIFTAGVTKETYAYPLFMLSFLLFLSQGEWRETLLFTLSSLALAMAHHLTALVTVVVLASIALATQMMRVRSGLGLDKRSLLLPSILAAVTSIYFGLYAHRGLKLTIAPSDWLSAGSHQLLAFSIALYLASKYYKPRLAITVLTCSVAAVLASLLALLCVKRPIITGAPVLPSHYLLYISPFILTAPLMVLGLESLRQMSGQHHTAPLFWIASILGLESYAVFGDSPMGLALAYRTLNFLSLPLATICALGLHRLCQTKTRSFIRRLAKPAAITTILLIAGLNSYSVYASISLQERYLGYFWLYTQPEYHAAAWATRVNQTVAGDVKASYLLDGYFEVRVDVYHGLKYLSGEEGFKHQLLYIYGQMHRNGYVLYGGYSVDLPESWTERLYGLDLLYSNGPVNIYGE